MLKKIPTASLHTGILSIHEFRIQLPFHTTKWSGKNSRGYQSGWTFMLFKSMTWSKEEQQQNSPRK